MVYVLYEKTLIPYKGRGDDKDGSKFVRHYLYLRSEVDQWISNVALVKKAYEKWKMCVDYTGLNIACPQGIVPNPKHR